MPRSAKPSSSPALSKPLLYTPADRAHWIARTAEKVQEKYLHRPEVAHLLFFIQHGVNPKSRVGLAVARPHFSTETVYELLCAAIADPTWGQAQQEESELVEKMAAALAGAVRSITNEVPSMGETAIMVAHPKGAACIAYLTSRYADKRDLRGVLETELHKGLATFKSCTKHLRTETPHTVTS